MAAQGDLLGFTHASLCSLAVTWLKRPHSGGGPSCLVAVSEVAGGWDGEIPDAIGFCLSHWETGATVVEVKVTRSDFLADRKKPHRQPGAGMGAWRYYMAPEGLIRVDELPAGWGLIEVNKRGQCKVLAGAMFNVRKLGYYDLKAQVEQWRLPADHAREQWLLVKLLARLGDPEQLNQQRRDAFRERDRLMGRVNELNAEITELQRDIRWQTRQQRLAALEEQQAAAIARLSPASLAILTG